MTDNQRSKPTTDEPITPVRRPRRTKAKISKLPTGREHTDSEIPADPTAHRPDTDIWFSVGLIVAGFTAWYTVGGYALTHSFGATRSIGLILALSLIFAAIWWFVVRSTHGLAALRDGLITLGLMIFLNVSLVFWLNQALDTSNGQKVTSEVLALEQRSKGPDVVLFRDWRTEQTITIPQTTAKGCQRGQIAELTIQPGFLGISWVDSVKCRNRQQP